MRPNGVEIWGEVRVGWSHWDFPQKIPHRRECTLCLTICITSKASQGELFSPLRVWHITWGCMGIPDRLYRSLIDCHFESSLFQWTAFSLEGGEADFFCLSHHHYWGGIKNDEQSMDNRYHAHARMSGTSWLPKDGVQFCHRMIPCGCLCHDNGLGVFNDDHDDHCEPTLS